MNKKWWQSRTVWGGILISLETFLMVFKSSGSYLESSIATLGVFLTIFGFRKAIK